MVATDVAGRGIDIKDVSMVINYDMAKTIEGEYLITVKKKHFSANVSKNYLQITPIASGELAVLEKLVLQFRFVPKMIVIFFMISNKLFYQVLFPHVLPNY